MGYRAWQSAWVEFGRKEQQLCREGKALELLLTRNIVTGATIAFRTIFRDLILPIPDRESVLLHDHWIALMIAAVSTLEWITEPLVKYRRHERQHTGLFPPEARNRNLRTDDLIAPDDFRRANPLRDWLLEEIRGRLKSKNRDTEFNRSISKLEHLQVRSRINRTFFGGRVRQALKELLRGRYHLYSDGLSAALKDISMPHKLLQLRSLANNLLSSQTKRG